MSPPDVVKKQQGQAGAGEGARPLPPPRPPSFAERTRQAGRLRLAQSIVILGGVVIVAGWFTMQGPRGPVLALSGAAIVLVGFIGLCLSVRCPKCRVAVVWHTFKTRSASRASADATYQVRCPKCGYEPS